MAYTHASDRLISVPSQATNRTIYIKHVIFPRSLHQLPDINSRTQQTCDTMLSVTVHQTY